MKNTASSILKERIKYRTASESVCPILHSKQMAAKRLFLLGIVCFINAKEELKWRILSR